jgi:hypothetical protein
VECAQADIGAVIGQNFESLPLPDELPKQPTDRVHAIPIAAMDLALHYVSDRLGTLAARIASDDDGEAVGVRVTTMDESGQNWGGTRKKM